MSQPELTPDPWGPEVEQAIQEPDAMPVCVRCFTPQEYHQWFCPECGSAAGPFNNSMPFVMLFSEGEVFRNAVEDKIKPTWLTVSGYVLLSTSLYSLFAPVYWFRLHEGFQRYEQARKSAETSELETDSDVIL